MDYNLALKLKNAGFPQPDEPAPSGHYDSWTIKERHGEAYYFSVSENKPFIIKVFPGMTYARESVYIPTLSELISELDKNGYIRLERTKKGWIAELMIVEPHLDKIVSYYESPDEALAHLWLTLQQTN